MQFKSYKKIISPRFGEGICGDPTVLKPEESPDGLWHLFYWGFYGLGGRITHSVSNDCITWKRVQGIGLVNPISLKCVLRPFIIKEDSKYYLFVQKMGAVKADSEIGVYESSDLKDWSKYKTIYKNDLIENISCPSVVKEDDKWKLYFSGGVIFTNDFAYYEPKMLYSVTSEEIDGDYSNLKEEYGFSLTAEYNARPTLRYRESKFGGYISFSNNMIKVKDAGFQSILSINRYDRVGDVQEIMRVVPSDISSHISHVYVGDGDLDRVFFNVREDKRQIMRRKLTDYLPMFSYKSLVHRLIVLMIVILFTNEPIYMAEA